MVELHGNMVLFGKEHANCRIACVVGEVGEGCWRRASEKWAINLE